MALIWSHDDLDPILEADELMEPARWEATHCHFCGELLDDSRLFRRNGWFHESCLERMEARGGIEE